MKQYKDMKYKLKASIYTEHYVTTPELRATNNHVLYESDNKPDCKAARENFATRLQSQGYILNQSLPGIALNHPEKEVTVILSIDSEMHFSPSDYERLLNDMTVT